jgi:hypothetical protein
MSTILIINSVEKQCGVYQYGFRIGKILNQSKNNNFVYLELDSFQELQMSVKKYNPDFIIYNKCGVLNWITPEMVDTFRNSGIFQFNLVHNVFNYEQNKFFDAYLHQHPYWKNVGEKDFAIPRPLPIYKKKKIDKTSDTIRIGSFGFGLINKYYDEVCRVVNEQFDNEKIELRLHLTHGTYAGENQQPGYIIESCRKNITKSNINLIITTDFLDDDSLLDFLAGNDLNVFFYQDYYEYNGISSVIDYALSVKKPIAINKSSMYSHIMNVQPSICVEDNYLIDIIKNGFDPLEEKYNSWSNEKFVNRLEEIIKIVS